MTSDSREAPAVQRVVGAYWPVPIAVLVTGLALALGWLLIPSDRRAAEALESSLLTHKAVVYRVRDIEAHPDRPELLLPLAETHVFAGRQGEAQEVLDRYLAIVPDDVDALRRAATLADWQLEPHRTAGYRMRIRALDPKDVEVREWLGEYLIWQQRTDEAIDVYLEMLAIDPTDLQLMVRAGDVLSWTQKIDDAIVILRDAVRLHPNALEAHLRLGKVITWTGDDFAAIDVFERALDLDPDSLVAWSELADLYLFTEQLGEREKALNEVRRLSSTGG
ncbi:MAG: tetratricopeptide repeat protein [Chloroflexi bacterium]|nr:tetratricopeptide repeat protein [Chloroflexota bacterium]